MGLARRYRPWLVQTPRERPGRFEGWYYKFAGIDRSCAFIPGFSTDPADPHAFIQYIDGHRALSACARYPLADCSFSDEPFTIRIGRSTFGADMVELDLDDPGLRVKGQIRNSPWLQYPVRPFRVGIMGPFALAGFLECYHGIVSANHTLEGSLRIAVLQGEALRDSELALDGGKGYIEKDWGHSFPQDYLWLQANSFRQPELSVFCSLATVPFRGKTIPGLIAFAHVPGEGFHTFATWNGARVEDFRFDARGMDLMLARGDWTLSLQARCRFDAPLFAPRSGAMERIIKESVDSRLEVCLSRRGQRILEGSSECAGYETGGSLTALAARFR